MRCGLIGFGGVLVSRSRQVQLRSVAFSTFQGVRTFAKPVLVHLYRREAEREGSLFLSAAQSHRLREILSWCKHCSSSISSSTVPAASEVYCILSPDRFQLRRFEFGNRNCI